MFLSTLFPRIHALAAFSAALMLLCGCDDSAPRLARLRVVSGSEQCAAAPDGTFPRELRIEALGGRSGKSVVSGVKVVFASEPGSAVAFAPAAGVTDSGGTLVTRMTAAATGDQFFTATPEGHPELALRLRVVNGVEISGEESETVAGGMLQKPVSVRLVKNGRGVPNVPVRFTMRSTAEGAETTARIFTPYALTDADGRASTAIRLGKATGVYKLGIDIDGAAAGFAVKDREVRLIGINPWQVGAAVLGGTALLIFGMGLMSDGLRAAAGERMKNILQLFTGNRVYAMLAGAAVTAGLQSSTAVTVMVIGFINAGLLSLKQSLGIIFGANIGTTVTAQLISFDLSGAALPAVAAGLLLSFSKRRVVKNLGRAIIGFGILFFGISLMSSELRLLGDAPGLKRLFSLFDCAPRSAGGIVPPLALIGAIAAGFAGTAILHSSAAFTGVTLALAAGGLVNFYTAFALLLGSNVGTTVTSLFAASRANRIAGQAALAHFIFNTFGALTMALLFYVPWRNGHPVFLELVNAMTPGDAFAAVPQNLERHIAMAHTLFNVAVAALLLPFTSQFAWICGKLLPIRDESGTRIRMLEPGLLATPSVALKQCSAVIRRMVGEAWIMIDRSLNGNFLNGEVSADDAAAIARMEDGVDAMQREVTDYLVQLMHRPLTGEQSELIPLLMHATNDAERIADHAENILELARRMEKGGDKLSKHAIKSLGKLWEVLDDEARQVMTGLDGEKHRPVKAALKDERRINKLADKLENEHIERLREGNCSAPAGVVYIEMLGELEKIGDRLANIAERTPQIQQHYVKL